MMGICFCLSPALAQEMGFHGEVAIAPTAVHIKGEKAKFNEYRDLRDGFYGRLDIKYDSERYYLDLYGADMGYRTQRYGLDGGKWGSFKYYLGYDEFPHNFTSDRSARTFYSGVGGANLTFPGFPPNLNIDTWSTFNYGVDRRTLEGGFRLLQLKPLYFDVAYSRMEKKGVFPVGAAGTSPGGTGIELPEPINWTTDNVKFEAGYLKNPLFLSLSYFYSIFKNDNTTFEFRNPETVNTAATPDKFTEPPQNDYYKLNLKGAVKLPWNSKFNLDLGHTQTRDNFNLLNFYVANVTAAASNIGVQGRTGITLSDYVFDGQKDTQNYSFALTSSPLRWLDGKLFYKYYNVNNKSDRIATTDTTASPATFTNTSHIFDYRKSQYGAELGFRLPLSFYLVGRYTHVDTDRTREDFPRNKDNIYALDLRWSGLDWMLVRLGYERLDRRADFEGHELAALEPWVHRFDAAPRERDTFKATIDFFPLENLNVSLGYQNKKTSYKDTILGRREELRDVFNVDADYLLFKRVRIFAYYDWEHARINLYQRQIPFPSSAFDPGLPPTNTAFNWTVTQLERNHAYGIGTDIYILPQKLTLRLQHSSLKADGFSDFTLFAPLTGGLAGRTQNNIDIDNWDDYRLRYYLASLTYNMTKSLSLAAGYAYEKYIYDDGQLGGYQYLPVSATGTRIAFLTGAYRDPSYSASVVFLSAAYRF